jgi:hypothetical protein
MLKIQEILNLLPAAIVFPLSYLPDLSLNYGVYLSLLTFPFLGLVVFIEEVKKPISLYAFYPDVNRFSVFAQSLSNMAFRHTLLM